MSGSRVRSVVNSIRSLYRWAQDRDLVQHDPAAPFVCRRWKPRLAIGSQRRARWRRCSPRFPCTTPCRTRSLHTRRLDGLRSGTPFIDDVDLDLEVIYLGADEEGRKSRAAQRAVPLVKPLAVLLRRCLMARGRPRRGRSLAVPATRPAGENSGRLSFEALQVRADEAWGREGLQRITAHECRHTCITWLDAAGVRPKVVSVLAGHALPRSQQGAAPITQQRYTHTLPGDLTRAGELFASYLAEATRDFHESSFGPDSGPRSRRL